MALAEILERTRADLALRKRTVPIGALGRIAPSDRSLAAALRRPRTGFILECKKASPSEGIIREKYNPAAIAAVYSPFADAVSVLTDEPFFHGSLAHLEAVRSATPAPVLRKDFVVDPYQVVEARAHGADAVLLMLSVLDDAGYRECAATAREVGIETLTEVHSEAELDRVLTLGAPVIGINNRDLRTLQIDLATTARLAPRVPADRVVVCESGIRTHLDVVAHRDQVDAFLIGTTLMRSALLDRAVRQVIHGHTKVCGLTRAEDARAAWEAGATHGGLIFAAESPRRVEVDHAAAVMRGAPLEWVGVFVNEALDHVVRTAGRLGLAAVQLHGDESSAQVAALRTHLPPEVEVWKAVRVRDRESLEADLSMQGAAASADRVVLDTFREGQRGGTGERFDWSVLAAFPAVRLDRVVLGGGLTPEVAAQAETTGVWGLDVSSGVESEPGKKDHDLVRAFLAARRGTGRARGGAR